MTNQYEKVACAGVDVHYRFSTVTFRDAWGRIVRRERLDHTDRDRLRQRLSQWPDGLAVVLEASFGWPWLSDVMSEVGLDPRLSNCLKVEKMRKARGGVKTNKKDADLLSSLLGERTNWWEVWLAPPDVRDRRERMRFRADLVAIQTQTKNRIHAMFHRHGIFYEFSDLFGTHGRALLEQLCRDGGGRLTGRAVSVLQGHVRMLRKVRAELATVARQLRRELKASPLARRLMTISGIGLILAHLLIAEIGRMERFANSKKLASYALLAPRCDDSGEADPSQAPLGRHLGQRGNRTLKWALIEAAHGAVRSGGKWRKMFDRYTDGGKKNRNRGYIKVARELVPVIRRIWLDGQDYTPTPTPTPRPGSRKRRRSRRTRSGTGQPSAAMVDA